MVRIGARHPAGAAITRACLAEEVWVEKILNVDLSFVYFSKNLI
jgi:hypothetical protein